MPNGRRIPRPTGSGPVRQLWQLRQFRQRFGQRRQGHSGPHRHTDAQTHCNAYAHPEPTPEPTATPEATVSPTPAPETDGGSGFPVVPVAAGAIVLLLTAAGVIWFFRRG